MQNRPGVVPLQLASAMVFIGGIIAIVVALGALDDPGFGELGATTAEKWVFVVTAAVPVLVGAGILFGLAYVVDLLYDLRDGRQTPVQAPAPPDGGVAY